MYNSQFEKQEVDAADMVKLQAHTFPKFRYALAKKSKVLDNILILVNGGLGDIVCAEPTIRWARQNFKNQKITLATNEPSIFRHIGVDGFIDLDTFNAMSDQEMLSKYNFFCTMYTHDTIHGDFIEQHEVFAVDYCSLAAFSIQLDEKQKVIKLVPSIEELRKVSDLVDFNELVVVIHAGVTWKSKVLPKKYVNDLVACLNEYGIEPVIVGSDNCLNVGASFVKPTKGKYKDLTNKLTVMELTCLLQNADGLITNESSPLHIAASESRCLIAFFATAKRPELLLHYRPTKGFRMKNFALNGKWNKPLVPWEDFDLAPIPEGFDITEWLVTPYKVVEWVMSNIVQLKTVREDTHERHSGGIGSMDASPIF